MGKHCAAVELLLARMDSNPEEFTENGRWEGLIIKYRSYLPMQDRTAMEDKINSLRLDVFHKDVMKQLLAEPSEDAAIDRGYYQSTTTTSTAAASPYLNAARGTHTIAVSPVTSTANALSLSNQSIKDIAAQLQQYASNTWKP